MIDRRLFTHFNWSILSVIIALIFVGFMSIYSATHAQMPSIYKKDVYWMSIGAACMLFAIVISYAYLERAAYFIYGASLLLLISVFFIGSSFGGAKRWISLGFFSLQPSEFAKIALIIMLAKYFNEKMVPDRGMGLKDLILPGLIMIIPFLLIAKQPDLGTGIIIWMIFWSMAFIVKIRTRVIAGLGLLFAAMAPIAWVFLKDYQKARLTSFMSPEADPLGTGYHVMQSKIAIGSGGVLGKGFLHGTQGNLMFLPEHHTDFIFAALAEEWGLAGALVVIGLFLALIISGLHTATGSKDRFGFLLAFGITVMFFWQITINLGMVSGLLPVVGVPLPFISYGGSFLITSMIAAGVLLNINMRRFIF
ncbi:MAG TPA: rod shape-determining protein RodA [Deltaproteobacteria bacterium]|nr:MAG: rod shape-determining protein RodA [Deltaproteobacteria bacterium GWA2_55_82]OGQ62193.1 MAG: rod shape-determining protein RodA [Deltaproteobacteria bacterium RIFCSPLOWO2_02_FULL_55_12]OIJ73234.1 MAG: rod shape-determining protein RodA [Deltaproteobacteria bacterium GWC2_55_46]HBG45505.1 rod shape-determining protein RodA [Deltaproteobacteria bacterium]HCY10336.1 rod shape-determining protein RodA [Deltaproteobacteria bacterium]